MRKALFLLPVFITLFYQGYSQHSTLAGVRGHFVTPINTFSEGRIAGHYSDPQVSSFDSIPLVKGLKPKKIYLVPVDRVVPVGGEAEYLKTFGLAPCKNAPNYLLGLMADVQNGVIDISSLTQGETSFAALNGTVPIVEDQKGNPHFLSVVYNGIGQHWLALVFVTGKWKPESKWIFLAEEI